MKQTPIKLLCIVPNPYMGGLQFMTVRLFSNLSSCINRVFLLTRWTDGEFAKKLDESSIRYEYTWFGMFSRRLDRHNLQMTLGCILKLPILYSNYLRLIRQYKPDAIYFASYHEIILLLPLLLILKRPIIYHVHNPLPSGRFYKRSFALWGKAVDHYIAVSSKVRDSIITLSVQPSRVSVLLNAIDLQKFPYRAERAHTLIQRFGWPDNSLIVGMTGQMFEGKGHNDFLSAAKIVHEKYSHTRFIIGGKINHPYYESLCSSITLLGLSNVIAFSGWENDMSKFYHNLDIFVLPSSQDGEGLPLVLLEAMATGLPTIASDSGGVSDAVEDGKTGILINRKSPVQLATAMEKLISSLNTRLTMGRNARKRIEEIFCMPQQVAQFESTVMNIVAKHD